MISSSQFHVRKHFIIAVFLVCLGLVNFWGSLQNPFIMDDSEHYLNSKKSNTNFLVYDLLPNQVFAANSGMQEYQNNWGYYRPFMHSFFRLQATLLKDNPVHYHLMCIVLFAFACFSIFKFLLFVTQNEQVAFLAAFLYLLHPFQGLFVNYKTAATLAIQIILLNAAFLMIVRSFNKPFSYKEISWYLSAIVLYVLALLIHELAFIFPVVLLMYWFILGEKNKEVFYKWIGLLVVTFAYLLLRFNYENFLSSSMSPHYKLTLTEFFAAYAREIGWALKKLIYPKDIFLQHATWVTKGMAGQWIWIFYIYMACFFSLTIIFYRRNKVFLFLWLLFMSGFVLSIPPSKNYLGDGIIYFEPHWIFYTSIGIFCLLAHFFSFLLNKFNRVGLFLLALYVFFLVVFSSLQNRLYHFPESLFQRWSEDVPNLDLPKLSLCSAMISSGRIDDAINCYLPLTQRVRASSAHAGLARAYVMKKDYKKAREYLQKAKEAGMRAGVLIALSSIAYEEGDYRLAIDYVDEALKTDRLSLDLYLVKVNLYAKQKKWEDVLRILEEAQEIYPKDEGLVLAKIAVLFDKKDLKAARLVVSQELPRLSKIDILLRLTVVLLVNKEDELAAQVYQKVYAIDPAYVSKMTKKMFICPLKEKKID